MASESESFKTIKHWKSVPTVALRAMLVTTEGPARDLCLEAESRIASLTRQRDAAIRHIAEWCVAIESNGSGWDDWDTYYKEAMYRDRNAVPLISGHLAEAIDEARKRRAKS